MEGMTGYKSVKGYWRRSGYINLDGRRVRRRIPTVELGGGGGNSSGNPKAKRFWRMRRLKLKLRRFSPKKFLLGLRDAYVNFMNKMAGSRFINTNGIASGYYVGPGGEIINSGFGVRTLKEYDEKMIIQIYKSLVLTQSQLVNTPASAATAAARLPAARIGPSLATIAEC